MEQWDLVMLQIWEAGEEYDLGCWTPFFKFQWRARNPLERASSAFILGTKEFFYISLLHTSRCVEAFIHRLLEVSIVNRDILLVSLGFRVCIRRLRVLASASCSDIIIAKVRQLC
jgi:hypothetical protein